MPIFIVNFRKLLIYIVQLSIKSHETVLNLYQKSLKVIFFKKIFSNILIVLILNQLSIVL